MSEVGTASMTIVPKFNDLSGSVRKALGDVDATGVGKKLGDGVSGGIKSSSLGKAGVLIGVFSAAANAALSSISSHVSDAAQRLDTLNNYPRVMETLGFSAKQTEASLALMDDRLQGLPTALNDMTSTVQGFSVITRDLDKATNLGLAINDMLLAGGQSQQMVNAATEQFRQILSKGKPEMQDWKSILQAAPGQLDQVAKSMLGAEATAQDLYSYLGGGSKEAADPEHLQEFIDTIIRLDQEGGAGITSFEEQARTATGGVQTSVANLHTAVTRGIAKVMDAVGSSNIKDATDGIKTGIDAAFGGIADATRAAMPGIKNVISLMSELSPVVVSAFAAFTVANSAGNVIDLVAGKAKSLVSAWNATSRAGQALSNVALNVAANMAEGSAAQARMLNLSSKLSGITKGPVVAAFVAAAAAIAGVIVVARKAHEEEEKLGSAISSMSEAASNTAALVGYSGTIDGIGASAGAAAMTALALAESTKAHADKMNETTSAAEKNLATLNTAQSVINEFAGRTNLTTQEQGRLQWALEQVNDEFGMSVTAADVAGNSYVDAAGKTVTLTDSINDLIEAKKQEIRLEAMSSNLSEAYAAQAEALSAYEEAKRNAKLAQQALDNEDDVSLLPQLKAQLDAANAEVERTGRIYENTSAKVRETEDQLGTAMAASSEDVREMADAIEALGDVGVDNVDYLATKLVQAGVSTQTLSSMGSESFAALAAACDGNVNAMVIALTSVDSFTIDDKVFSVTDDGSIYLGEQKLGTLNSFELDGKHYWVDDSGSIVTEEGKVAELHNKIEQIPDGSYRITGTEDGTATSVIDRIREFAGKTFSYVVSGGQAPLASGALGVRLHAAGAFITDGPTNIGVDRYGITHIAGEAGRELVQRHADGTTSVIPIENEKYLRPFADKVKDMNEDDGGATVINNNITMYVKDNDTANAVADALVRKMRLEAQMGR